MLAQKEIGLPATKGVHFPLLLMDLKGEVTCSVLTFVFVYFVTLDVSVTIGHLAVGRRDT